MRLKSAIFVSALVRTANGAGAYAAVRRRGAEEAGAVFVKVSTLDGRAALYGPASQSDFDVSFPADRLFRPLVGPESAEADSEARMVKEMRFDPDLWLVEIEDRAGRTFIDLVPPDIDRSWPRAP
ncbi:DUF1491 family protein [Aquabacter spiritensis]|uniref:DUF1491 family protein n=1 Tax=Aquabacter spiritensis TaxID=933073 RepID=A0A4R3LXT8_9HYPH|nr:DUF1491 family protein [Aquabacter spiritensis]TCT03545.1 hypothetical protein EDC64_10995 [Aquabacter spiritensis]